jgi:hypothetical protein
MRRLLAAAGLLLLAGGVMVGCGDDGGEDEESFASVIPPATAISPTSAPTTTAPAQNAFPPAPENCDPESVSPPAAAEDLELAVDTGEDLVVGDIIWTLTLTNTGDAEVNLVYPSGQDGDVALRQGGQDVYRWSASQAFTEVLRCQTLGPGERHRFELGGTSLVLEPGAYRLVATLAAEPTPAPFRTSVTLIGDD